jgi:hypothetical protein
VCCAFSRSFPATRTCRGGSLFAAAAASTGADLHTLVGDVTSLLSPSTELGEIATAFDPNAIADITSLLSADLAPNASTWAVDLFSAL